MEVEIHQFSLQALHEALAGKEVLDDAVRERVAVQLQVSCTQSKKDRT